MPEQPLHAGPFSDPSDSRIEISHPSLTLLRSYRQSTLPATIAADISEHLASCLSCSNLLNDLAPSTSPPPLSDSGRHLIPAGLPLPPPATTRPGWRWNIAIALVIAFFGITLYFVLHRPATPPTDAELSPPTAVPIDKLPPALPPTNAPDSSMPTARDLAPAFSAYTAGNYPLAASRFYQLTRRFPNALTPTLYLGVTQLLENDPTDALPNLARADALAHTTAAGSPQSGAAAWYHALAALNAHAAEAPSLVRSICAEPQSTYHTQACKLVSSFTN